MSYKRRPVRPFAVYIADNDYIQYLQNFDNKVVNVRYGKEQIKPFIGPVFEKDGMKFYAPITSPKQKYITMNDGPTFFNLIPETQSKVVGTLLIGNMIPIPDDQLTHINYDHMERYIKTSKTKNLGQYGHLIELQLRAANQNSEAIKEKAKVCYQYKLEHPDYIISSVCNEYNLLMDKSRNALQLVSKKVSVRNELNQLKKQNRKGNNFQKNLKKKYHVLD